VSVTIASSWRSWLIRMSNLGEAHIPLRLEVEEEMPVEQTTGSVPCNGADSPASQPSGYSTTSRSTENPAFRVPFHFPSEQELVRPPDAIYVKTKYNLPKVMASLMGAGGGVEGFGTVTQTQGVRYFTRKGTLRTLSDGRLQINW
jgi:hypothetical protein